MKSKSQVCIRGKGNIWAEVIADSINFEGDRLTTFRLHYPRFIHCFDNETEILCKQEGEFPTFKKLSEAQALDCQVAAITDDFQISFEKPSEWIARDFAGELVSFSNQRLDFKVTDNHRLFVASRNGKKEIIFASQLLDDHDQKRFFKTGSLIKRQSIGAPFAKFLAYFISDGHLPQNGKYANFHFKKQRKIDEILRLCNIIGIEHKVQPNYDGSTTIHVRKQAWMPTCYNDSKKKCIPAQFWNMDQNDFHGFKSGLIESDGSTDKNGGEWFNTRSEQLIDEIQALCHYNKISFNKKKYNGTFKIKFLIEDTPIIRKDKHKVRSVYYTGKVYCCTVSTGLIMVRRNGIVHISGNSEFMTHRTFSRNASSSRAIPVNKVLEQVNENPAMPIHWGKNQPGMQAKEEHNEAVRFYGEALSPQQAWKEIAKLNAEAATAFSLAGYHKQVVNRLLEPYQFMNVVVSATDWSNFFGLRVHADADPNIQELATLMQNAIQISVPEPLKTGEWHTPYVDHFRKSPHSDLQYFSEGKEVSKEDAIKISASCAAQASYRKLDTSLDKALSIYDKLVGMNPKHASPFEHVATPFVLQEYVARKKSQEQLLATLSKLYDTDIAIEMSKCALYCGNFLGWTQWRKTMPNENIR